MFNVSPLGDQAVLIQLGETISPATMHRVRSLIHLMKEHPCPGLVEWTPAYTGLTVYYDPYQIDYQQLAEHLLSLSTRIDRVNLPPAEIIHIPVCYGGELGPDLPAVARHSGLSPHQVIQIHSQPDYLIYMLGFTPGFPYLGGMSPQIATPRLAVPRKKVPAGSVGIAGQQTGIYSMETPGGWQIIGRTPLKLYDPSREPFILLKAGNYLRFEPISEEEYVWIQAEVEKGVYRPWVSPYRRP